MFLRAYSIYFLSTKSHSEFSFSSFQFTFICIAFLLLLSEQPVMWRTTNVVVLAWHLFFFFHISYDHMLVFRCDNRFWMWLNKFTMLTRERAFVNKTRIPEVKRWGNRPDEKSLTRPKTNTHIPRFVICHLNVKHWWFSSCECVRCSLWGGFM